MTGSGDGDGGRPTVPADALPVWAELARDMFGSKENFIAFYTGYNDAPLQDGGDEDMERYHRLGRRLAAFERSDDLGGDAGVVDRPSG